MCEAQLSISFENNRDSPFGFGDCRRGGKNSQDDECGTESVFSLDL
jgi:hypothetical protein